MRFYALPISPATNKAFKSFDPPFEECLKYYSLYSSLRGEVVLLKAIQGPSQLDETFNSAGSSGA